MFCVIRGNDLYLRARGWSSNEDFVWKCCKINAWDDELLGNKYFNIEAAYTCPAGAPADDISTLTLWKASHDDICPLMVQGTPIGANHGFNCVDKITSSSHGKTPADIGSVWLDSAGRTYCLVKIPDANTLRVVMFNDANMETGKMSFGCPSGTLTHHRGAVHTEDILIESRQTAQLWQSFNHYSVEFLVDGQACDLPEHAVLSAESIAIVTRYDVIYVPSMLRYLMDHVGNNTNDSQHSDEIQESYLRLSVTYEFHDNGSISTYSSVRADRDLEVDYIGLVQSMTIGETPYTYVPDTTYEHLTLQEHRTLHNFGRDTWNSCEKAPYRYYQFDDRSCEKGMALVYDRNVGWGDNAKRLKRLTHAGRYYGSRKMYPAFISGGSLSEGESFEGFAARIPLHRYDEELTALCWYWLKSEIILMIDVHKTVDKEIVLPAYMDGRRIKVLDKTDSCTLTRSVIADSKLQFHVEGYGYLVARLY